MIDIKFSYENFDRILVREGKIFSQVIRFYIYFVFSFRGWIWYDHGSSFPHLQVKETQNIQSFYDRGIESIFVFSSKMRESQQKWECFRIPISWLDQIVFLSCLCPFVSIEFYVRTIHNNFRKSLTIQNRFFGLSSWELLGKDQSYHSLNTKRKKR